MSLVADSCTAIQVELFFALMQAKDVDRLAIGEWS